jgi:hypothetical protein
MNTVFGCVRKLIKCFVLQSLHLGWHKHIDDQVHATGDQVLCAAVTFHALSPVLSRDLWQHSWLAALKCTPLQELAAERAASAEGVWEAGGYQDGVRHSALFQAFMAAGCALKSAAAVRVSRWHPVIV